MEAPKVKWLNHMPFKEVMKDEKFKFFVDLVLNGHGRAPAALPISQQFTEKFGQGTDLVFSGKLDPEKFLQNLNVEMNKELVRAVKLLGIE